MNKETLLAELDGSTTKLVAAILQFTPEAFNHQSSENAWSPAQVAEHLLKVDFSTNKALQSETVPTNRPPDQKLAIIKSAMEDSTKRVAPERVYPSGEQWQPAAIIEQLKKQRALMREAIYACDITDACTHFRHPALGTMTKLEWVYFNIYHAERHRQQLLRLAKKSTVQ